MAFVLDKLEDMRNIYEAAKKVYTHEISVDNAVSDLMKKTEAKSSSLKMYFNIYAHMRKGKCYKMGTSASFTKFLLEHIFSDFGEETLFTALKATKLHAEYRASVNNEQPGIEKVCREIIDEQQVNIDYDSLPSYQSEEISIVLSEEEKQRLLYAIQKSNAEFSEIIMSLIEQYQILNDSDIVLLCNKQKSRELFSSEYAYFKEIDVSAELSPQLKSPDGRNRYYGNTYVLNEKTYVMTSQLYGLGGGNGHKNNRNPFHEWILNKFGVIADANEWWPSREEYTPGFTKNQWLEILNNSEILGPVWGEVLAMFHTEPNGATCKMIAERFNDSPYSISGKCTQLAKKIHAVTGCPLLKDEHGEQEKQSYWPILFLGRDAKGDTPGTWIWKLRSELYEALTEFGIEKYLPKEKEEGEKEMTIRDQITVIKTYIAAKGFNYDGALIENFYLGLKSKPFVILAGTSGTGKTRLVRLFAEAIGAEYKLVSVRPDWSDSSDLFGHVDLNQKFVEGSVIKFVKQAELNPSKPYFLCLDEMNLARVEYYMSDILSAIETRRHESGMIVTDPIDVNYGNDSAAAGRYGKLILPGNLYIVGTVNMDETTFPFSKKVLDRANTIEFSYVDLLSMPSFSTEPAPKVAVDNDFLASKYITLNDCDAADKSFISGICTTLSRVNGILEMANAHIGYRVRDEIVFYMLNNKKADLLDEKAAFDNQIMQKILPRIQGSSESIKKMLEELLKLCDSENFEASAKKINFMIKRYDEDGFTSYWL